MRFSLDAGGEHFEGLTFQLCGVDPDNLLEVSPGDRIIARVTFDQLVTIPASVTRTAFFLNLFGDSLWVLTGPGSPFPRPTETLGTVSFDPPGPSSDWGTIAVGSAGLLSAGGNFWGPDPTSIAFISFTSDFVISSIGGLEPGDLVSVDRAELSYALVSPSASVPVPGALLLFGPGLFGLSAMRRKLKK